MINLKISDFVDEDDFFAELMAFPSIKKRTEMDLSKKDGLEVLLTSGKIDKIEQTNKL